jgi:hypothetical protein
VPWQAIGTAAFDRLIALRTWLLPYRQGLLTGAVRGLLVSPWFAAGAGFVVAAGAFMYAPHAKLEFGSAIGVTQCKIAKCHPTNQLGAPGIAAGTGDGTLPTPGPSPSAAPAATARLTFGYTVTSHLHGQFQMLLTVTGKKAIGTWSISFVIPGATDVTVAEATSQQTATASPAASPTPSRTVTPGPAPSPGSSPVVTGDHGADQTDSLYLIVKGDGTPSAPTSCIFDGARCSFSPS